MQTVYAFRAASPRGEVSEGFIDAESPREAREILAARGLYVLTVAARGTRASRRDPLPPAELALGLRILADLLESGLSVARALQAFEELAPKAWRPGLPHLRQAVREGHGLASAFAAAPVEIPGLVIGIVQAGEAGAGIAPAIRRAADLMESSAETRAAIRSALAYPMVVAGAGAIAVLILITVVLPRFARILEDLGQRLPASTRFVIDASDGVRAGLLPGAIILAIVLAVWRAWVRTPDGKRVWHRWLLGIPGLGSLRASSASARIAHSLSAMLESGVAISPALVFASKAASDAELEARITAARGDVASGEPLSRALESRSAVTSIVVRLIRAGEESGRLPSMLEHAARIEQQRADRIVRTSVRLLEPMLLLTFASVVALIAAALLQAIYSVRPTA